jgi:hypothetical protein
MPTVTGKIEQLPPSFLQVDFFIIHDAGKCRVREVVNGTGGAIEWEVPNVFAATDLIAERKATLRATFDRLYAEQIARLTKLETQLAG